VNEDLARRRVEYDAAGFHAADAGDDPMIRFAAWFSAATEDPAIGEPNAMTLATAAGDGTPSARMVLLKGVDPASAAFTWFTNLDSRKAREAVGVGRAALCWWWPGTPGRQVRAVGRVEAVARDAAAAYFETRPESARVGAAASRQSRAVRDRAQLDARVAAIDPEHLHLPDGWGGLRLIADELEFWQGRTGRLHDRITFLRLDPEGGIVSHAGADAAGGEAVLRELATSVTDEHGTRWLRVRLEP
jgi:pyridoxamine 5'-phosphate oxidase